MSKGYLLRIRSTFRTGRIPFLIWKTKEELINKWNGSLSVFENTWLNALYGIERGIQEEKHLHLNVEQVEMTMKFLWDMSSPKEPWAEQSLLLKSLIWSLLKNTI